MAVELLPAPETIKLPVAPELRADAVSVRVALVPSLLIELWSHRWQRSVREGLAAGGGGIVERAAIHGDVGTGGERPRADQHQRAVVDEYVAGEARLPR